jgi:hypothetical protein
MKKRIGSIVIALMLAAVMLLAVACAAPGQPAEDDGPTVKCTISVDCSTALAGYPEAVEGIADENGFILPLTEYEVAEGSSVYDAMISAGLEIDESKGYVSSVAGLGEGDCGPMSGWLFDINGEYPLESLRDTTVNDGDVISWRYTCDGGADLGLEF